MLWALGGVLLAAAAGQAAPAESLVLARDGESAYTIVVARDAIAPEKTAATELQSFLKQVTGVELPIRREEEVPERARQIVVGPSARFRALAPGVSLEGLGHDGIVIRTVGRNLLLAGGRPRGTLYAVYTFLEDVVGCRWWTSRESTIPRRPTLTVPPQNIRYVPRLICREAFYRDAFDGVFAARSKCNGHFERVPPEYGGHYTILGWCHTFYELLPPNQYFAQHPEWYSEIGGQRKFEGAQLCLTNEEMRAELTRQALAWIRKDPAAGMISISQNDWHGRCECARCLAVEQEEGGPSGPLIRFVNAVAEEIEKEFPGFLIETLAYTYTRKPPLKTKPRDNVVIRLCSIECSFAHPMDTGEENRTFREDVEGWSKIAKNLYIWNYVTNFSNYLLPQPNMRQLANHLRFFVKHNAIGLFEQGDAGSGTGDFIELRTWVLSHLMWDPARDERQLIREFLEGYYGAAAPHLQAYLDTVHDAVEREGVRLPCYVTDTSPFLKPDDIDQATLHFRKAEEAVAGDPVLAKRVRRARLPLDLVWLTRYQALRRHAQVNGKPFLGPEDGPAACEEFIRVSLENNVGQYGEGRPFEPYAEILRSRFGPPATPPAEVQGRDPEDWHDFQQTEMSLAGLGTWVTLVDDPAASDGRAARMPGGHTNWAAQYPISGDVADGSAWRCYVYARHEGKAPTGTAFLMGIYDGPGAKDVVRHTETLESGSDGKYRVYDLGVHVLKPGMYFWVAPPGNADAVEAVYVDRFVLVREKQ
ncbi:MAG: DUF4838 domain-containing protein [Armatimonadetes bacterium]|jgi:hypothetical protein|nr:DUF4838 domain-containing protein [Armatimonadota bacterium]